MKMRTKETPVLRIAVILLLTTVAAVLQTTVFVRAKLFGASPDIMLTITVIISAFYGKSAGALEGLFAGFVTDCLGTSGLALSPLLYFLCGYAAGLLFERSFNVSLISFTGASALTLIPRAAVTLIELQYYKPDYPVNKAFTRILVPEAASTLVFCSLMWLIVVLLSRRGKKTTLI